MSVEYLLMLLKMESGIKSGCGLMFKVLYRDSVTGARSNIVVTLFKNVFNIASNIMSMKNKCYMLFFEYLIICMDIYLNMLVWESRVMMIIILNNSASVSWFIYVKIVVIDGKWCCKDRINSIVVVLMNVIRVWWMILVMINLKILMRRIKLSYILVMFIKSVFVVVSEIVIGVG